MLISCLLAATLLAAILLLTRAHTQAEQAWTVERRELLERIQRPEHVPVHRAEPFTIPDPEPDELNLIGTINHNQADV